MQDDLDAERITTSLYEAFPRGMDAADRKDQMTLLRLNMAADWISLIPEFSVL